ncbi:MAG: hypothetical protein HYV76_02815 [Candidatus Vogelbacteria bacterium]|nr:hypothetical protein [Candidatus Vogelbacteria bacterium]
MNILSLFKSKGDSRVLKEKVTKTFIKDAHKNRTTEIESLKQYDRGEKEITPRDLNSAL